MDDDAPPRRHLRLVETPARAEEIEDAVPTRRLPPGAIAPLEAVDLDDAPAPAEPDPPALQARFVVLALVAFQAMGTLSYLDKYVQYARTQAVSPAATLLGLPALLALYAGAALLVLRPGRGRGLFLGAAVGLGLAVPFWGLGAAWTWPVALGSMLGLAGAWVARRAARQATPQP